MKAWAIAMMVLLSLMVISALVPIAYEVYLIFSGYVGYY